MENNECSFCGKEFNSKTIELQCPECKNRLKIYFKECSLNAKEGDWCTHYKQQCFVNCEYGLTPKLKLYYEDKKL